MASKRKITPFARLLLFLVILVPLAYGGASYIRGEDPIANVKEMVSGEQSTAPATRASSTRGEDKQAVIERLKKENRDLKARIQKLEAQLDSQSGSSSESRQKWGQ